MILIFIFFLLPSSNYYGLVWSVQDEQFYHQPLILEPQIADIEISIAPRNITVSEGSTIIWLNNGSTSHLIVSGTPEQGPSNIFYGDYFGAGESYNVTLDNAGVYNLLRSPGVISKVK